MLNSVNWFDLICVYKLKGDSISCDFTIGDGCTTVLTTQASTKVGSSTCSYFSSLFVCAALFVLNFYLQILLFCLSNFNTGIQVFGIKVLWTSFRGNGLHRNSKILDFFHPKVWSPSAHNWIVLCSNLALFWY